MIRLVQHRGALIVNRGQFLRFDSQLEKIWPVFCNLQNKKARPQFYRHLFSSIRNSYPTPWREERIENFDADLKLHAMTIFKSAVSSVRPRRMIESVLQYDRSESTLTVDNTSYHLHRNIFIVGFGKAALGMARATEDILGEHIVSGIISIPRGLSEQMLEEQQIDSQLAKDSKIQTYEGSNENQVDEAAYNASKAINTLVSKMTEKDIVIVLNSGGGSALLPSPHPPISIDDLRETTRLLAHQGGFYQDLSIVRKNIESLKGGGLVKAAKPAKILCLIISSNRGDLIDSQAGGPTYPCYPTPHHSMQILQQMGIENKVPCSVITYLEKVKRQVDITQSDEKMRHIAKLELQSLSEGVQNVVIGSNSVACEAASEKAIELGYLPVILTEELRGEARKIGALYAKLAKFITFCFDHKMSVEDESTHAQLELDLVASGMKKRWINLVTTHTDMAHHMNEDICIITGGEMVVNVKGNGVGGKNMECALGAASEIKSDVLGRPNHVRYSETKVAFLSANTDGHDGVTKLAGAVIDNDFVADIVENDEDVDSFLDNNDSLSFFENSNNGKNLIDTKFTGTNVKDIIILLVKRPRA